MMADNSKIEWTNATWNPITGCSVVSAGCKNCYAMKLAGTRMRHHPSRAGLTVKTKEGPVWNGQVRLNEEWLNLPLRWKKPRRIFVCAHGDLFHENVPDEGLDWVFAVMALARADGVISHGHAQEHGGVGVKMDLTGKKNAGRLLDGVEHNGFPQEWV